MTWGEFKAKVEEQGLKDSDEVAWIDCSMEPRVQRYEDGTFKIDDTM